jgi:hypothetical protein
MTGIILWRCITLAIFGRKRGRRNRNDPERSERTDAGIVAVHGGTPGVLFKEPGSTGNI